MKSSKALRIAGVAFVVVALTTCAIAATYAKYVTQDSSADSARVAKFGVVVAANDDSSFKTEYAKQDKKYSGTLSVKSSTTDRVVAPGTASSEKGITFSISGKPEVATKVDVDMTVNNDIFMAAGQYSDYTVPKDEENEWTQFQLDNAYNPVVFTLKQDGNAVATGSLSTIKEALKTYADAAYNAPNTDLATTFTLTWAWAFDGNNAADTWLGNVAADSSFADGKTKSTSGTPYGGDYDTDIDYTITITVTQVD